MTTRLEEIAEILAALATAATEVGAAAGERKIDPSNERVQVAVAAVAALLPALPPGYVAVPEEPTREMVESGDANLPAEERWVIETFTIIREIWAAMLSARPALSDGPNHIGDANEMVPALSTESGLAPVTVAAAAIMDVFCGGNTAWRDRMDQSEILESADWARAVELAEAALAARPTPPAEGGE